MSELPIAPETDDDLASAPPLSPKELAFCEAYGNPESASYGNARKSAEAAGYVQAHSAGWKLRRRPSIRAKLQEYHKAVTVAVGRVLADLENERLLALAKGDVASAVRASELMGKHLGMFRENLVLDVPSREYTELEVAEARRITAFLLANPGELPAGDQPLALAVPQEEPVESPAPAVADSGPAERLLACKELVAAIEAKAKERKAQAPGKSRGAKKASLAPDLAQEKETRDELAARAGVSHGTLAKAKFLTEHADAETKRKLRTAERPLTWNDIEVPKGE